MIRDTFLKSAQPLPVKIGELPMQAAPKEFRTGSLGWYSGGKFHIKVGEEVVNVQVGLNITIIGSKPSLLSA